ncbi:MAG: histidine kinase [Ferruginibacter sp.]
MRIRLPQYSGEDYIVMLAVVPGFALFINYNIFGFPYFSEWGLFWPASLLTVAALCVDFIVCGWIAVTMRNHFPNERQVLRRLTSTIFIFLLITAVFLYSLFNGYESFFSTYYKASESGFIWCYFSMGILNVFITFLMEGITRYRTWKVNWLETEKLKKTYKERQLQGLKNQVNQHFLFDSLNALSGLIKQEGDEAESFLDEMSKVYRYMLRTDEEQLVTLDTELKFIESYLHLLKARYGDGLLLEISVLPGDRSQLLPPLSLQAIVENTFLSNEFSDARPLKIAICSAGNNVIEVSNNVQPKNMEVAMENNAELDSLVSNYQLVDQSSMVINDAGTYRTIQLPLIIRTDKKEEMV